MTFCKLHDLKLKDLNHLLLAYFTKPEIFSGEQIQSVLERISVVLDEGERFTHSDDFSTKTTQILVFNLALHGKGSNTHWRKIMKLYESKMDKKNNP
jgi:hypothetical protein